MGPARPRGEPGGRAGGGGTGGGGAGGSRAVSDTVSGPAVDGSRRGVVVVEEVGGAQEEGLTRENSKEGKVTFFAAATRGKSGFQREREKKAAAEKRCGKCDHSFNLKLSGVNKECRGSRRGLRSPALPQLISTLTRKKKIHREREREREFKVLNGSREADWPTAMQTHGTAG